MSYETFIGLEIHIHLLTKTKVFCTCPAAFGDEPNTNVCPVCMGYPGVLPSLNDEAMHMSALVAKALGCRISPETWFERKQYFYPDMAKNYQISQFASPVGVEGAVELLMADGTERTIRIKECHLEEDAGKMIHAGGVSLIDYNRAGTSLLEIVTEPDLKSGAEAEAFIQLLRRTVRYLGVCDGNMEEGSLRCDANISINTPGAGLGSKVELKNLNSSRFVRLGLDYEAARQAMVLDSGGRVVQETRLWNENRDQTETMRRKESAHDYRYFPEPDLPIFRPDAAFLERVEKALVELPAAREARFRADFGLGFDRAAVLCEEKELADWFEAALRATTARGLPLDIAADRIATWVVMDIKRILNREGLSAQELPGLALSPERLAAVVAMLHNGEISGKTAKEILDLVLAEDRDPEELVADRDLGQIRDPARIEAAIAAVFAREEKSLSQYASAHGAGDEKALGKLEKFFTGKVLQETAGRADPAIAGSLLKAALKAASRAQAEGATSPSQGA